MITQKEKRHKKHKSSSRRKRKDQYCLITDKAISSSFAESYRTLHTNIHYSFEDKQGKLLMITSSVPKEGKTTTAINLAITMAEAGKKVLLVDTDLRIPSIYKIFKHDRNQGLTNILIDVYTADLAHGNLSEYGLGDLFHILNLQGKSGLLTISANGNFYDLRFHDGLLIDVLWKNRPEEERIGNLLVECGKITPVQQTRALKRQAYAPERLGSILTNLNLLSPKDLEGPLRHHLSGALHHIYSLKKGTFSFQEDDSSQNRYLNNENEFDSAAFLQNIHKQKPEMDNIPFINQKIGSCLQDGPVDNLKILNAGPIPSNPTELLASRRMHELMGILKKRFDVIIFDTPPVNSVTDACVLAPHVDGVILVAHVGHSNRKGVQKAKQQLEAVGAKVCGVILNRLDVKKHGYYYYGYYGNYYRYYHYGDYQQQKLDGSNEPGEGDESDKSDD